MPPGLIHGTVGDESDIAGSYVGHHLANFASFFILSSESKEDTSSAVVPAQQDLGPKTIPAEIELFRRVVERFGNAFIKGAVPQKQMGSEPALAFGAIGQMLKRLEHVTSMKILQHIMDHNHDDVNVDVEKLLPKDHSAVAHAMTTWQLVPKELKDLEDQELDLTFIASKIGFFESFSLAVASPLMDDPMFSEAKDICQKYVTSFLQITETALTDLGESVLSDLKKFDDKYQQVVTCAETWQMEPVQGLFEEEANLDAKSDIEQLQASYDNVIKLCESLKDLIGHSSTNEEMKRLIGKAHTFIKQASATKRSVGKTAFTLIVAACILTESADSVKASVDEALQLCRHDFGVTQADLPGKLGKMVADMGSGKPVGKKRGNAAPTEEAKAAPKPKRAKPAPKEADGGEKLKKAKKEKSAK